MPRGRGSFWQAWGFWPPPPNVFASFNFTIRNIVQRYFLMVNNCKIHILAKKIFFSICTHRGNNTRIPRSGPLGGGVILPPPRRCCEFWRWMSDCLCGFLGGGGCFNKPDGVWVCFFYIFIFFFFNYFFYFFFFFFLIIVF